MSARRAAHGFDREVDRVVVVVKRTLRDEIGTVMHGDPVGSGWRGLGDTARLGVDVPKLKQRLGQHGFFA